MAARYHSLVIAKDSVPDVLEVTAWTEDGTVMAVQHKQYPGIQVFVTLSKQDALGTWVIGLSTTAWAITSCLHCCCPCYCAHVQRSSLFWHGAVHWVLPSCNAPVS